LGFYLIQVTLSIANESFDDVPSLVVWIMAVICLWVNGAVMSLTIILMGYVKRHSDGAKTETNPHTWIPIVIALVGQIVQDLILTMYGMYRIFICLENAKVRLVNGQFEVNIGFELFILFARFAYLAYLFILLIRLFQMFPSSKGHATNPFKPVYEECTRNADWEMGHNPEDDRRKKFFDMPKATSANVEMERVTTNSAAKNTSPNRAFLKQTPPEQ
jgi:hypothetical protein